MSNTVLIFTFFPLIALFFGAILTLAARFLAVKRDERIEQIQAILPGVNCGACGFPGCLGYSQAIVETGATSNLCTPGGDEVSGKIALLMGQALAEGRDALVAFVHCRGDQEKAKYKFDYRGLADCQGMVMHFGGDKICSYGCLGGGSCISICPTKAIIKTDKGIVEVNPDRCIGCEKCIASCPTGVIQMIPKNATLVVACHSKDKGGITKKCCTVGCIGCKLCDKKSPEGGYIITDNLASIEYQVTGSREEALLICPAKCIVRVKSTY